MSSLIVLVLWLSFCEAYIPSTDQDDKHSNHMYSVKLTATKKNIIVKQCDGAQVGLQWVITAAECLDETKADEISLIYSAANNPYRKTSYRLETAEYVLHPQYDPKTKMNNIALIKCRFCGQQPENEIPKVLPTQIFSKYPAAVASVLDNEDKKNPGFYVQYVPTRIVSWFWCKLCYLFSVGRNHICAFGKDGRLQKAQVGAPLVVEGKSKESNQIVGIATSIVPWTTWISLPTVYTRVTSYNGWIRNVTKTKTMFLPKE